MHNSEPLAHLRLDHVAIAVRNLDQAIADYFRAFGIAATAREEIATQQVEAAFLELPNCSVELITPLSESSSVHKFLEKRGEGLHHICFLVDNISSELDRLSKLGYSPIDKTPRQGARGKLIAFLHPKEQHGVLIELAQKARH